MASLASVAAGLTAAEPPFSWSGRARQQVMWFAAINHHGSGAATATRDVVRGERLMAAVMTPLLQRGVWP